jgi:hypothetical protein
MIVSYLSCNDDSLDENYYTLAAAIIQQAAVDYRECLECIFALRTPPSKRSKKLCRRINSALARRVITEDELLHEQFQKAERIERFFYSRDYGDLTDVPPDIIMDAAEREASLWAEGKVARGKQLKVNGLRTKESGAKEFIYG